MTFHVRSHHTYIDVINILTLNLNTEKQSSTMKSNGMLCQDSEECENDDKRKNIFRISHSTELKTISLTNIFKLTESELFESGKVFTIARLAMSCV